MTLFGMWGFDTDTAVEVGTTRAGNTVGRVVGRAWSSTADSQSCVITLPGSTSSPIVGMAFRQSAFNVTRMIFAIRETASISHVSVWFNFVTSTLEIRGPAGTVVATSAPLPMVGGAWYYIEGKVTIANSGGTVEVRWQEEVVVSYTGDTQNGGSGVCDNLYQQGNTSGGAFDDTYVVDAAGSAPFNDYLGDIVVRTLVPTGNGDLSEWTNSAGNTTNNWTYVDDTVPPSMSDHVQDIATVGKRDLYAMTDVDLDYNVLAVQALHFAAKSDGGTPTTLHAFSKGALGGTRTDTAYTSMSATPLLYPSPDIHLTDPDGNPLTAARLNAMQIGQITS